MSRTEPSTESESLPVGDDGILLDAARLQAFAGDWVVTGTMMVGGTMSAITGRWYFERTADGQGVRGRMETTIEGFGALEEDELIGYDPSEGLVHMISMNRLAVRDHRGSWVTEDVLEVEFSGQQLEQTVTEVITVRFVKASRIESHVTEHADGALVATTDLIMTRQA